MSKSATATTTASEPPTTSSIPLHNLYSSENRHTPSLFSTTSNTTLPPSYSSTYAPSIASTTRDLLPSNQPFKPTTILQIQSVGKDLVSWPTSTKELCIPIFACDAEGKTERPKWLSIRPNRGSGSCFLADAEDAERKPIARTKYRFGPGRPPVVRIGGDEDGDVGEFKEEDEDTTIDCGRDDRKRASYSSHVDDHGKKSDEEVTTNITPIGTASGSTTPSSRLSISSSSPVTPLPNIAPTTTGAISFPLNSRRLLGRTIAFSSPRHGDFEWRYCSRKEKSTFLSVPNTTSSSSSHHTTATSKPDNLLVLEKIFKGVDAKGKEREIERVRVAQLIRSEETRTPGSRGSSAGNGGRLECCLERVMGEGVGVGDVKGTGVGEEEREVLVDEVTVVVTCMVMLKKEIDRLRGAQIAVMSAGASGGP
ncbi:hypothetical protein ONS95_003575 [Cadophora gregata]|uniref:uncharacterized protein n=1 Tax=Cadophora gregata TaxID=51156 RepID=UPI0026DC506A|nr:uncharacterized protein ONS95_003575 [Cadophora gregata]KAK0106853.1 hypothetical protein ONS95_003575 [Cadophora gregata]